MEITPKIHLLKIDFSVQIAPDKLLPRFVNSLIIFGNYITIIDSGVKDSYHYIYDYIERNGRHVSEINLLILSHSHPDHIGSAYRIKSDTGCKIMSHQFEKEWIENIDLQFKLRPVPGFYNLVDKSVELDGSITGDEKMILDDDIHISFINTPGHSKGSFCILFDEDSILFTADAIPLENDIPTYDNFYELKESLQRIKFLNNYKILLSSWTSPLKDKKEISKLILNGETYLERIDSAVKEGYAQNELNSLDNCKKTIKVLNLPELFVNQLVDKAFRTHL
jgi:hydroxyacylglutathione hydrolase